MNYLLSEIVQPELINKYCYSQCKRLQVGSVIVEGGTFSVCHDKQCKYSDKEMPFNDKYTMRKLRQELPEGGL